MSSSIQQSRPFRARLVSHFFGHNGLVAALLLARQKLDVLVVEEKNVVGGACRTEQPFQTAPNLGVSTGAL